MFLSRVFIKNYRSIEQLDLKFESGKNVVIGRNNSGKSNVLKAIDLVLGENSPDYKKSENVTENDFFTQKVKRGRGLKNQTATEIFIWCELTRKPSEELDYEELYKSFGFFVCNESQGLPTRKRFDFTDLDEDYGEIFRVTEDTHGRGYLNPKLRHQLTYENEFRDKYSFAFAFKATRGEHGVEKEIRFLYRENNTKGWILAFRASMRNALLQSAIIPSFRDPQSQLRIATWSWYGKLLKHLLSSSAKMPKLNKALTKLQKVANEVFESPNQQIADESISVAFPDTKLTFQFATDKQSDLYKGCVVYLDDGFKSLLTEKGAGIQSATVIGLFNFFTKKVNVVGSALLGIEEPELYLHPHARRVLSDRLDDFLDGGRNQVIMTTHSVEFIRSADGDLNIIQVIKSPSGKTTAKNVNWNEFRGVLIDNNQNEIFFADKVVICEGHDEFVLRLAAKEIYGGKLDEKNITIVSVHGKDNILKLVASVIKLGIDCYVFADFDYLLRDKKPEREQYEAKAHSAVSDLPIDFFNQGCLFGKDGKKVLKSLEKMRKKIKKINERAFYTAKAVEELNIDGVKQVLKHLRSAGVGLLSGELETFSADSSFLSSGNKLSLEKVHAIKERIINGEKISQIFKLAEIEEFLKTVIERPGFSASAIKRFVEAVNTIKTSS